jgi:hypothetical protein
MSIAEDERTFIATGRATLAEILSERREVERQLECRRAGTGRKGTKTGETRR